jgi:hypothetical protein
MMKVEITINTAKTGIRFDVNVDILAREDASHDEWKFCKIIEKQFISMLQRAAKRAGLKFSVAYIGKTKFESEV